MADEITLDEVHDTAGRRAWVDVHNAARPDDPASLEVVEHFGGLVPWSLELIARVGDTPAGVGVVAPMASAPDADEAFYILCVLPEHRRRGVGTRLHRTLSERARAAGKSALLTHASERDPDALAVAARWGFERIGSDVELALELAATAAPPVDLPAGIVLTTLAERPELARGVHAVAVEAEADVPGQVARQAGDFETYRLGQIEAPWVRPEAWFVALADDEVVGYAVLGFTDAQPGVGTHWMTGVARAWRGRGIAGALKRASIAWAKSAGLSELRTSNEERNAPMRAVNERLGYRPLPASITLRGPLAPG